MSNGEGTFAADFRYAIFLDERSFWLGIESLTVSDLYNTKKGFSMA